MIHAYDGHATCPRALMGYAIMLQLRQLHYAWMPSLQTLTKHKVHANVRQFWRDFTMTVMNVPGFLVSLSRGYCSRVYQKVKLRFDDSCLERTGPSGDVSIAVAPLGAFSSEPEPSGRCTFPGVSTRGVAPPDEAVTGVQASRELGSGVLVWFEGSSGGGIVSF